MKQYCFSLRQAGYLMQRGFVEQYDFFKENYEALKNGFLNAQDFYGKAS